MPRRPKDARTLSCDCDEFEAGVVDELKRICGLTTDANLVRTALWNYADDLGLDFPNGVFDLRWQGRWTRPLKTANVPKPVKTPRAAIAHGRKQARSHPWAYPQNSKDP